MTDASEIFDLFTSHINDYRITALFQTSGSSALNLYLEPWLLDSLNELEDTGTTLDLTYSTTTQTFTATLSRRVKNLLAHIMVKYWLQKEVNDILQMQLHLQDRDFRTFAESNHIREKRELHNAKKEEISQLLVDYGYKHVADWDSWKLQDFD